MGLPKVCSAGSCIHYAEIRCSSRALAVHHVQLPAAMAELSAGSPSATWLKDETELGSHFV